MAARASLTPSIQWAPVCSFFGPLLLTTASCTGLWHAHNFPTSSCLHPVPVSQQTVLRAGRVDSVPACHCREDTSLLLCLAMTVSPLSTLLISQLNPSFSSESDPGADCCVWFVHSCFSLRAKVSVILFTRRLAVTMGALTTLEDGPPDDLLYDHGPNSRPSMENPATLGTAFQLLPAPNSLHPQHLQSYKNIFPSQHFIFGSFFPPNP